MQNENKPENEPDEDELEEMLILQSRKQNDKKHRGYGKYERRGIYRGVKAGRK
ncbi:BRD group protein [Methanosalsum zhilinae DSM 4017]|uniref:BRD group protein n=1 Tax=Methanosalsum zhilinae (strain DSM 4017 / NBRC 107636 / OCM 62 / WeN5) TaxID=679901 RepID=F7XN59_METZD|nr:hypothetical protein [Methanosalsum zhilinae]AEH60016.1 BRD group protein [Methanosalsum zhilinae DSM 4017]